MSKVYWRVRRRIAPGREGADGLYLLQGQMAYAPTTILQLLHISATNIKKETYFFKYSVNILFHFKDTGYGGRGLDVPFLI